MRVFSASALYVPPDVALDVTVAVEPIDPTLTAYLYCNVTPSGSDADISILTGEPSVASEYEALPADDIVGS